MSRSPADIRLDTYAISYYIANNGLVNSVVYGIYYCGVGKCCLQQILNRRFVSLFYGTVFKISRRIIKIRGNRLVFGGACCKQNTDKCKYGEKFYLHICKFTTKIGKQGNSSQFCISDAGKASLCAETMSARIGNSNP